MINSSNNKVRFKFGKNWDNYLNNLNDFQINYSVRSLSKMLPKVDYKGKSFLDVGCGSGLSSLSAIKLGVKKNMFVDICWWNKEPSKINYITKKPVEITKIVVGNKIMQNGRMITDWTDSKMIYPNLYSFKKIYPTIKQMNRVYKNKPVLLKQGVN